MKKRIVLLALLLVFLIIPAPFVVSATDEIVYSLAEDSDMHGLAVGTDISDSISGFRYLQRNGGPTLTIAENNGISVTGRVNAWDALDIRIPALNLVPRTLYTIHVTGRVTSPVPENAIMVLGLAYGAFPSMDTAAVSGASPEFTLSKLFTPESEYSGIPVSAFDVIRIQTFSEGADMSFTVESIVISALPPLLPPGRYPSMTEAFSDYFPIGSVWGWPPGHRYIGEPGAKEHLLHHHNALSAVNDHKPASILPETRNTDPSTWNWDGADAVVDWAEANDLMMVGHTMLWHYQSRYWLTSSEPDLHAPLTRAEAIANMEMYINALAGRYRGRIWAWDVVNEVIAPTTQTWGESPDWRTHVRHAGNGIIPNYDTELPYLSIWYDAFANGAADGECGSDYIYYAFRFARLADPYATLIYNDYSTCWPVKREAIAQMVEQINERWRNDPLYDNRLLIEVIGMQTHVFMGISLDEVRESIERYIQTGARLHVTEMSIHPVSWYEVSGLAWFYYYNVVLTPAQLQLQADMFRSLFEIYMEFSDYIDRVTKWNTCGPAAPFSRDESGNFIPKPSFWAIMGLVGIEPGQIPIPTPPPTLTPAAADTANVTIDGVPIIFPDGQGPAVEDGRTLVPVRGVFETLGFYVYWERATQTAVLTNDDYEVRITVGNDIFTVNGVPAPQRLDVPAQTIGGRTLVPIRLPLESVGFNVGWDNPTRTVLITSG